MNSVPSYGNWQVYMRQVAGMVGWDGTYPVGARPAGIHPLASVGGPPENRKWLVGDPVQAPQIAESALVHAFCTVDGSMEGDTVTTIGENTFLQARVHVGEAAVIGDDCEICAGTVVCGHVTIGDGARIGGNSWIKPRVRIGDGAIIGGGSVVTKDVPAHEVWAGNPARFMKNAWTHPDSSELEQRQRAAMWQRETGCPIDEAKLAAGLGAGVAGDFA